MDEDNQSIMIGSRIVTENGVEVELTATWPQQEDREKIYQMLSNLNHAIEVDNTLVDKIVEQASKYYTGELSKEETVQNILSSVSTYMVE